METSTLSHAESNIQSGSWFDKQAAKFEQSRFFWMSIYMVAQCCWGSIAAALILTNNASDIMLLTCATLTMGCNAALISLAPAKFSLITAYLSLIINTVFILMNL
jgi:hypothetical protein